MVYGPSHSPASALGLRVEQAKADPADLNEIVADTAATALRSREQTRPVCHHNIQTANSLATAIGVRDEANRRIGETEAGVTARAPFHRQFDDLPPARSERLRLR